MVKASYLGLMDFEQTLGLQERARDRLIKGEGQEILFLLQHNPVISRGYSERGDDCIIESMDRLEDENIPLIQTDRGGGLTYHGPGQLVGYPVLDLQRRRIRVRDFVEMMENAMVKVLDSYSISAGKREKYPGVWVGKKKLGFVGINVKKGVTLHGFSLNVNNDLTPFGYIVPCGITDGEISSMKRIRGSSFSLSDVASRFVLYFAELLEDDIRQVPEEEFLVLAGAGDSR